MANTESLRVPALALTLLLYPLEDCVRSESLNGIVQLLRLPAVFPEAREMLSKDLSASVDLRSREIILALWDLSYILNSSQLSKRNQWAQAMLLAMNPASIKPLLKDIPDPSFQEVSDTTTFLSDRLLKLWIVLSGEYGTLGEFAFELYEKIYGEKFHKESTKIERTLNALQSNSGVLIFMLSFIRLGDRFRVREWMQQWMQVPQLEEEFSSFLYWFAEILWFEEDKRNRFLDIEGSLKYIYHTLLVYPERAHFLEVDSRYFTEFQVINELAHEGLQFKEIFVREILKYWTEVENLFDAEMTYVMRILTQVSNKSYDSLGTWQAFWEREENNLFKDLMLVVEGNLSFGSGQFSPAKHFYEAALKINPSFVPAQLNLLFVSAKLKDTQTHQTLVNQLQSDATTPLTLISIANSYLLLGDHEKSQETYDHVKSFQGWDQKTDFYRSTFCYEQGMFDQAVQFAKIAYEKNPSFEALFHFSCCLKAVGKKEEALQLLHSVEDRSDWIEFYRFTLERDTGNATKALETLKRISTEYFQDPNELEEAIHFAKRQADLTLLRRLTHKD